MDADVRRELYNTSRRAGAPSLPGHDTPGTGGKRARGRGRSKRRKQQQQSSGYGGESPVPGRQSPLRSSARFESAGVPKAALRSRSRTASPGANARTRGAGGGGGGAGGTGGPSRFPLLPSWATTPGTSHLLGAAASGPARDATGPRIVAPTPEVADGASFASTAAGRRSASRQSTTVVPSFMATPQAGGDAESAAVAAVMAAAFDDVGSGGGRSVMPLDVNPYATLQAVTAQRKQRRQPGARRGRGAEATPARALSFNDGASGVGGDVHDASPSTSPSAAYARRRRSRSPAPPAPPPTMSAVLRGAPSIVPGLGSGPSVDTERFPVVRPPGSALALIESGRHPLAQRIPSPQAAARRRNATARSARVAASRASTPPVLPSRLGTAATDATGGGTARFEVDTSATAANLHRGKLHEQLKGVMKQERAARKRLEREVDEWREHREYVSDVSMTVVAAQAQVAEALRREKARTVRLHDKIMNEPQRSGDAQRLLRMRIERNFSSMVKRWLDAKLGWAMRNWRHFVLIHREYSEWADRVSPHAIVIQRIYRSWRSRMIIRAARQARVNEARRVASLGLQAAFRGHQGRKRAAEAKRRRMERLAHIGACALQRLTRGFLARKRCDRLTRAHLRAQLKRMGLGSLALLYEVLEGKRWPDEHLEVLEIALDVIRATGSKGRGEYTFPVIVDLSKQLTLMEAEREAMKAAALQEAEDERTSRVLMHNEEQWQRSNEANMAATLLARRMKEEAIAAKEAREAAEQAAIIERREAVVRREAEAKLKIRKDAEVELGRRDMLREKERKAQVMADMEARIREDKERRRQAKLLAVEEKRRAKLDAAARKRTLQQLKKIKAVKQQQERWEREKARKARAAAKKKALAKKQREEREKKEEKARMKAAMKARARAATAKKLNESSSKPKLFY